MDVRYLFDSAGAWIAFQHGKLVFDRHGAFLGWTPWEGEGADDVITPPGDYLGTILPRIATTLGSTRSATDRTAATPATPDPSRLSRFQPVLATCVSSNTL